MFKTKAFWVSALVAIVAALVYRGYTAPTEESGLTPKTVALITAGPGPYWQAAVAGAESAAEKLGIELKVQSPTAAEDIEQQMQMLSRVGLTDVDAVAVSPIDGERQMMLITQLAMTRPVVTFDSDATRSARHGYVGTSNVRAGEVAADEVIDALPEGGKVAVFVANQTKENQNDRLTGLKDRLAGATDPEDGGGESPYSVVGVYTDQGDNEVCKQHVQKVLEEHPDVAGFVTLAARQGPVVLEALESLGKAEGVQLIAFDTPDQTLDGVAAGKVYATIAQDPYSYGYEAVKMLNTLCRSEGEDMPVVGRPSVHISVEAVTQENVEEFRKRLAERNKPTKQKGA